MGNAGEASTLIATLLDGCTAQRSLDIKDLQATYASQRRLQASRNGFIVTEDTRMVMAILVASAVGTALVGYTNAIDTSN